MSDVSTSLRHRSRSRGVVYALTGALLFGVNGSVSKVVMESGITPEQLTFFRSASVALIAGTWLLATDKGQFRISRRELAGLAALGVLGLAMIQWLYSVAISLLPVGVALLFEYTAVIIVALAAWLLFKEKVSKQLWFAIACVLLGLAVVAQVWESTLRALGVVAALGAAVAYAFYFLAGERGVARRPPMTVVFWASLFSAGVWAVFSQWWTIPVGILSTPLSMQGSLAGWELPLWIPLLWIGTLGAFAPFLLSFAALGHLNATTVGILASSEVLFAFLVAWLWLSETLTTAQLAGAAVVFVGIVLAQLSRDPAHADSPIAVAGDVPVVPAKDLLELQD
jgi:drug/metabolite transporter (DMT)-like permease